MTTFATLQTDLTVGAQLDATADAPTILFALREAYRRIWFRHRNWDFRRVGPTALTVASGVETPTLDKDSNNVVLAAEVVSVYDELGDPLARLNPHAFDDEFRWSFAQDARQRPWAFKWQNGVLTLGPRPNAAYAFTYTYERQVGYLAAGTTFTVGYMTGNTDTPAWDANHHEALVWAARAVATEAQGNPLSQTAQAQHQEAMQAMDSALLRDTMMPAQWPRWGDG